MMHDRSSPTPVHTQIQLMEADGPRRAPMTVVRPQPCLLWLLLALTAVLSLPSCLGGLLYFGLRAGENKQRRGTRVNKQQETEQ